MSHPTTSTGLDRVLGGAASRFESALGLVTVGDLLAHYPRGYVEHGQVSAIEDLVEGAECSVQLEVLASKVHPYTDKRTRRTMYRLEVQARLADGEVWMTFFDKQPQRAQWRREKFMYPGRQLMASGRPQRNTYKSGRWELVHPTDEDPDTAYTPPPLRPVYPIAGKVTSDQVERSLAMLLELLDPLEQHLAETLPEETRRARGLIGLGLALRWIHRPEDHRQLGAAQKRLRLDEALRIQVALARRRATTAATLTTPRVGRRDGTPGVLAEFDRRLAFTLTRGQQQVSAEIFADLARPTPMRRLLQGEVGSGKTVVALRAMLQVVDSGGQAALLAPTEVLAQQHHRSISRMLGPLAAADMLGAPDAATRVTVLTGSMAAAPRRRALSEAASGQAGIVIGTHALIQQVVSFADLGLVVVDEQHRFGVEQRAALSAKAEHAPHELVMTATPIPRTVAITVFGDLETSALTELPAGRAPIQSNVVPLADQPAWGPRIWSRVHEEVARGHQVYVVCPRIDASGDERDGSDPADAAEGAAQYDALPTDRSTPAGRSAQETASSRRPTAAVEQLVPILAEDNLSGLRLAALHGRMSSEDKDATMSAFTAGEIDVLVCTTVIEVGVDVPNATMMVVLDADRFGLSQLHQLRGRVGRGGSPGLCLLVTEATAASPSRSRLDAVAATTDGFQLAELDLELRNEGDVLGTVQSGRRSQVRLLKVRRDLTVIEEARVLAAELVGEDPELAAHPALREAVLRLSDDRVDYLDKS